MLTIKRTDLLLRLQQVQAGTTSNPIIEQSSCFVFRKGYVFAYNGEVACRMPSGLDLEIMGAVQAKPMVDVLSKEADDDIMVSQAKGSIHITGRGWKSQFSLEADITLPFGTVDKPKEWKELPTEFSEAMELVEGCTNLEGDNFAMSCIHVTAKWVEACSDLQVARFTLDTPIKQATLVKKQSIKGMLGLGMTHFSESEKFLHFRNATKLIYSCRRYAEGFVEDYPDMGSVFAIKGKRITLPTGMGKAVESGQAFTDEHSDKAKKLLILTLDAGRAVIAAVGVSGMYMRRMKLKYTGPKVMFSIPPRLLKEVTEKYNEGQLSGDKLIINGGRFTYVSCLGAVDEE